MGANTDFLFVRPSFWRGVARLLDFRGTLDQYNISSSPEDADYRALRADWRAVGGDLRSAVTSYAERNSVVAARALPHKQQPRHGKQNRSHKRRR